MGACCDLLFRKQQSHVNENRLKLLENKIAVSYSTENDHKFTYYLNLYHQTHFLQKILISFKEYTQRTQDDSQFELHSDQVLQQYEKLTRYIKDLTDQNSQLQHRIREDHSRIKKQCETNQSKGVSSESACMIKLQIQDIELVKGINRIGIIKQGLHSQDADITEYFVVNRVGKQKIYREFVLPAVKSRLKMVTDPIDSSITIDVEDIAKHQVICDVFNFKHKQEEFGYVAMRMQFVSTSSAYMKQKLLSLAIIEKQLKMCLEGKDGLNRLSEYHSDTSSHRQTFISDEVSEYNNYYHA